MLIFDTPVSQLIHQILADTAHGGNEVACHHPVLLGISVPLCTHLTMSDFIPLPTLSHHPLPHSFLADELSSLKQKSAWSLLSISFLSFSSPRAFLLSDKNVFQSQLALFGVTISKSYFPSEDLSSPVIHPQPHTSSEIWTLVNEALFTNLGSNAQYWMEGIF